MSATVSPFPKPPRPPRPMSGLKPERVAGLVREMILQDELAPGTPIRERTLAEKLNVSRTPLREALKILATEGLVELQPRRGATVAAPGDSETRELLQLLGVLEAYAARLCCEVATEDDLKEIRALHYEMLAAHTRNDRLGYFHRNQAIHLAIVRATGNAVLIEHHGRVNARVYRARYIANLKTERWVDAIREHEQILEALDRRDAERLKGILENHVLQAWDRMQAAREERVPASG